MATYLDTSHPRSRIGDALGAVVTFDDRLAEACGLHEVAVASPGVRA